MEIMPHATTVTPDTQMKKLINKKATHKVAQIIFETTKRAESA